MTDYRAFSPLYKLGYIWSTAVGTSTCTGLAQHCRRGGNQNRQRVVGELTGASSPPWKPSTCHLPAIPNLFYIQNIDRIYATINLVSSVRKVWLLRLLPSKQLVKWFTPATRATRPKLFRTRARNANFTFGEKFANWIIWTKFACFF